MPSSDPCGCICLVVVYCCLSDLWVKIDEKCQELKDAQQKIFSLQTRLDAIEHDLHSISSLCLFSEQSSTFTTSRESESSVSTLRRRTRTPG